MSLLTLDIPDDYLNLFNILYDAFLQASEGKGAERHGNGLPFCDQPMQTISSLLQTEKGMAFQACKKIAEACAFTDDAQFERELHGAIVYVAGMVIYRRPPAPRRPAPVLPREDVHISGGTSGYGPILRAPVLDD